MSVTPRRRRRSHWPSALGEDQSSFPRAPPDDSHLPQDVSSLVSRNISYDESLRLLPWQTENNFVLSGYRRQLYSIKACLWSSFSRWSLLLVRTNEFCSAQSKQISTMRLVSTFLRPVIPKVFIKPQSTSILIYSEPSSSQSSSLFISSQRISPHTTQQQSARLHRRYLTSLHSPSTFCPQCRA